MIVIVLLLILCQQYRDLFHCWLSVTADFFCLVNVVATDESFFPLGSGVVHSGCEAGSFLWSSTDRGKVKQSMLVSWWKFPRKLYTDSVSSQPE